MQKNLQNRVVTLLEQVCDMYEQFISAVQKDIVAPLANGDQELCKSNLAAFGKNITVTDVIKIVVRGASQLGPLMLKLVSKDAEKQYLDEQEIAERTKYYQDRIAKIFEEGMI